MLFLMCVVVSLVVGASFAFLARKLDLRNYYNEPNRIPPLEFALGSVIVLVLTAGVTLWIGPNLARNGAVNGYKEFYNGSVTKAVAEVDRCTRDGSCAHTYKCDPYEVEVVDSYAYTDSDGNYHPEVSHWETRYHDCPYATREISYFLNDSLGRTIMIGANYFELDPKPWRDGRRIPSDVPRKVPHRWQMAKNHLEEGLSDPVTGVYPYANFILASENELYKEYDGSVAQYKKAGLLPKHTANLGNKVLYDYGMRARKIQAVGGLKVDKLPQWNGRLMRLNAALGSELRGDMHVVLMPAAKVSNPDDYITSLKAHWMSLGKWSISKNGIILALGVSNDGKTVEWSRAETGMPEGNGTMQEALKLRLSHAAFNPDVLLGNTPAAIYREGKVKYDQNSAGMIGKIVLTDFPYKRPCMKCEDKEDSGVGYVELKSLVPITTGAKVLMFFIVLAISTCVWWIMLYFDLAALWSMSTPGDRSRKLYDNY